MIKFKFSDIGEGLHEGVVAEIYKKDGDKVKEGESLFSVETDKVTSDIPSPATGIINKVLIKEGQTIRVGEEIFYISEEGSITTKVENKVEALITPTKAKKETSKIVINDSSSNKVDDIYDVIVIGSGPGGFLAAEESGKYNKKTLIIEKEYWGGVCLNVGCIPTKALLTSVGVLDQINKAKMFGIDIECSKIAPNWKAMQERKTKVVDQLVGGVIGLMRTNKVTTIKGEAKFTSPKTIEVNNKIYKAENIIIATGSRNRKLSLPGFEHAYQSGFAITAEEAINITEVPKELVIIGGGVIGIEFSQIFASVGSKVTIIQNEATIIPALDEDIIKILTKKLEEENKIEIIANATTSKIEDNKVFYMQDGIEKFVLATKVMVSVGRIPNILNTAEVGIQIGPRNELVIDEFCETNIPGVFAIGDVTNKIMLAHVAYQHGHIAVNKIIGKTDQKYTGKAIPACIYTHPEIASVGLSEKQVKKLNREYFVEKHQMKFVGKAIASGETDGLCKLIVATDNGEILGAHIIGSHATDLISELVVALNLESTVVEIANSIHPHPTFSEVIWEAARSANFKLHKIQNEI